MDVVANPSPAKSHPDRRRKSPGRRRKNPYRKPIGRPVTHGKAALTRVLRTVPLDDLDGRSAAGVFLRRTRADLMDQLGDTTPAQRLLIDEASRTALIARAIGDHITRQETIVRDDSSLLPVVLQREVLVGNLVRVLVALGLKRRTKRAPSLAEFVAEHDGAKS